ncbi:hypothetical protein HAX54_029519, partial [Datura stramonium]|nr:hypothetical protein [Datura stramonium]
MSLLSSSRFLSPSFSSNSKTPASCCTSVMSVKMKAPRAVNKDAAILWYKHDLRVDDHPGIVAASMHRTLVPLYIFDPRILSRRNSLDSRYGHIYNPLVRCTTESGMIFTASNLTLLSAPPSS